MAAASCGDVRFSSQRRGVHVDRCISAKQCLTPTGVRHCFALRHRVVLVFLFLLVGPANSSSGSCILRGRIHTSLDWYGYLLQKTFQQNVSRIQYTISYPVSECCVNLLIYYDDQMRYLNPDMTCEQREAVLPVSNNQIIPLSPANGTVGCEEWKEEGKEPMYVCIGERTFRSSNPRTWYVAVSRCGSSTPLTMNYNFNISGYYGNCEEDPLAKTHVPQHEVTVEDKGNLKLAIGMGVFAGVALCVAIVFITLFIISRRQMKQKPKTSGSVTSSQATMTQDIFYVNPSLSDRDHSDSQYSRSSSENYYEVIPDRRSYESINTQLALHGHGGRALNLASIPREHRTRIPSYLFEDIPPPPYQPPNLHPGQQAHVHQGSMGAGGKMPHTSGMAHPLTQASGPNSYGSGGQQVPMTSRLLPTSSQPGQQGIVATTTRAPLQSSANTSMPPGNTLQIPNHSSTGNYSSGAGASSGASAAGQQQTQNGGITTSAGGLNSHNTNTLPRSQGSEHGLQLQNGGPMQNGSVGTMGRYPLHNTNHAKLLNHAYRIQQFETTA